MEMKFVFPYRGCRRVKFFCHFTQWTLGEPAPKGLGEAGWMSFLLA